MILAHAYFMRSTRPFQDWYASLFPQVAFAGAAGLYRDITYRRAGPTGRSTVAPFADVLALGSVEQKQAVVTLISDNFRPEFATALLAALNDPEPAIRVQAATASARVENMFLQQTIELEAARAQDPDNTSLVRQLADLHIAYAEMGLLDEARARAAYGVALELLQESLGQDPDDASTAEAVTIVLLRLGRANDAIALLEVWAAKQPPRPWVFVRLAQAHYSGRDYARVQSCCAVCARLFSAEEIGPEFADVVAFWARSAS
jgi:tetratricopeptide (TPR) repeat protein